MIHRYIRFESDPFWPTLERAVAELVANGDLQETTDRTYIVGYLCQSVRNHFNTFIDNSMAISRSPDTDPKV